MAIRGFGGLRARRSPRRRSLSRLCQNPIAPTG